MFTGHLMGREAPQPLRVIADLAGQPSAMTRSDLHNPFAKHETGRLAIHFPKRWLPEFPPGQPLLLPPVVETAA